MPGRQDLFQKAMNAGHSAAWDQNWEKAAEFYRKLIEDHPKSPLVEEARKGLAEVTMLLERMPARP